MRRLLVALAFCAAAPCAAQASPSTADSTEASRARMALRRIEQLETTLAARRDSTDADARAVQRDLLLEARTILDRAILQAPDGARTLAVLQREYPGAALLREYEAWRRLADGMPLDALALFEGLLRAQRRNVPLLRGRAKALDALGREPAATQAWQLLLDAYPIDDDAFAALWERHQRAGTMIDLHRTIVRLRLLYPNDNIILGREVRVLQALGLPDSAAAVVRRFQGGT